MLWNRHHLLRSFFSLSLTTCIFNNSFGNCLLNSTPSCQELLLTGIILMETLFQHQQFLHSRRDFEIISIGCSIDLYPFSIDARIRLCWSIRVEVEVEQRTCGKQFLYEKSWKLYTRQVTPSPLIPLKLYTLAYWSNPPFSIFDIRTLWRSGLSARAPECQKLNMVGYGAGPFEQQQFWTAGVEGVNKLSCFLRFPFSYNCYRPYNKI